MTTPQIICDKALHYDKSQPFVNNQLKEWVCKPSSVPALSGQAAVIYLDQLLPVGSPSNREATYLLVECAFRLFSRSGKATSYLVLQAVGFALPASSPAPRCALTAPFHHCPRRCLATARRGGCVFSVALSLPDVSGGGR